MDPIHLLHQPPTGSGPHLWALRQATAADYPGVVALSQELGTGYVTPRSVAEACRPPWARLWVGVMDCPAPALSSPPACYPHSYLLFWVVPPEAEIHDLAVAPSLQRRGGGRALVSALLREAGASGIERLHLEVRESGKAAQALYRQLGFVPNGRRAAYYADTGEDALCLTLAVQPAATRSDRPALPPMRPGGRL
jgi:ribosomal protein S18 acetylase RimI-like enzyme